MKNLNIIFLILSLAVSSLWREDFALVKDKDLISTIKKANGIKILIAYGSLELEAIIKGADAFFDLVNANKYREKKEWCLMMRFMPQHLL